MGAEVEAAGSVVQQVESTLLLVEEGKGGITGGLVDFCLGAIMGTLASLNLKEEKAWGIRSLVENLFQIGSLQNHGVDSASNKESFLSP